MNVSRIIIAAGAAAYTSGVLLAWWGDGAVDRSPLLYINLAYAFVLLVGSYTSDRIQRNISLLMAVAIYSIQTHALYLVWANHLPPSLVGVCSTIALAPIATFGYAFKSLRWLVPYLLTTTIAVLWIGLTAEAPQVNPASFIVTYVSLAGVCFVASAGQLRTLEILQKNSERQRALVDAIPDAMLRISQDGTVLDSSIDPSTSLGRLVTAPDGLNLNQLVERTLAGEGMENLDLELWDADGNPLEVEVRMVKSGDGEITAILRDVTVEKAMKARLMVSDRMAALGTLSVGIGHEINNPLTYVESNLRFAMELIGESASDADRDARILEALTDAAEGADRVQRIVNDLRRSVRIDDQESHCIANASSALQFAVRVVGNQLRSQAQLDLTIPDDIMVEGAEGKLGQVFLNLLVNAMQAFDATDLESNRIVVRAETTEEGDAIFEIQDNGPGIPARVRGRIFDPFFTTKEVGVGSGLGLYICHQIVSDLGGELTIDSEPNKGTRARVRLRTATPAAVKPVPSVVEAERLRVLVIDDEPGVLRACERMLRKHEVTTCGESPLALKLIADDDYDVILCDLMMPKMTGMDLFESVERDDPEKASRMVFISGGAFRADAEKFLDDHAEQHLAKPFDRDGLLGALDRSIRRRAS